jgi:hypothetical protein
MFVRVTRGHLDPAKFDEVQGITPDIAAAIRALPGCQSHVNAGDRAAGTTITVTTWATEEHARFSRTDALAGLMSRLQTTGIHLELPEIYESFPE